MTLFSFAGETLIDLIELNESKFEISRPLYETSRLFKDYRISQPIRGLYQWFPVFLGTGYAIDQYKKNKSSGGRIYPVYSQYFSLTGLVAGPAIGMYNGIKYNKRKRVNPDFHLPKNKYGYEINGLVGELESDVYAMKHGVSFYLTANLDKFFFNEYQVGISYIDGAGIINEVKPNLRAIIFFREDKILSPFWGTGIGISKGDQDSMLDDIFLFGHTFVGLRINLLDFCYFKYEMDCELSAFDYYLYKELESSNKSFLTSKMTYGIKLF